MKRMLSRLSALSFVAALLSAATLASCAGAPQVPPEDLSASEIVQRAQEASDRDDYDRAVYLYEVLMERFGSDSSALCTGEYEIGFIRYKQGRFDEARRYFATLLARYEAPGGDQLPARYRILAGKILEKMETQAPKP